MQIEQARAIIADRLRTATDVWTDARLHSVLCFAEDGKMRAAVGCCCFIGVESSKVLHSREFGYGNCPESIVHYNDWKESLGYGPGKVPPTEEAYIALGSTCDMDRNQEGRDREFLALLRAEISRREASRESVTSDAGAVGVEVA